ncbi:hypothetical protein B0H16DRAFT_314867 [Mycena metata]|uniref:Uncharacterized protein n=1 Tax=Mycena metata TaxID=1033252 RepID=A0AAD7NND6_9AGAR|nr:hypothetical protein B0H16DRAFT_314867 [Mycena metata]
MQKDIDAAWVLLTFILCCVARSATSSGFQVLYLVQACLFLVVIEVELVVAATLDLSLPNGDHSALFWFLAGLLWLGLSWREHAPRRLNPVFCLPSLGLGWDLYVSYLTHIFRLYSFVLEDKTAESGGWFTESRPIGDPPSQPSHRPLFPRALQASTRPALGYLTCLEDLPAWIPQPKLSFVFILCETILISAIVLPDLAAFVATMSRGSLPSTDPLPEFYSTQPTLLRSQEDVQRAMGFYWLHGCSLYLIIYNTHIVPAHIANNPRPRLDDSTWCSRPRSLCMASTSSYSRCDQDSQFPSSPCSFGSVKLRSPAVTLRMRSRQDSRQFFLITLYARFMLLPLGLLYNYVASLRWFMYIIYLHCDLPVRRCCKLRSAYGVRM